MAAYYQLNVVELSIDISGASPVLRRKMLLEAITTNEENGGPKFRLPPSVFTVGKSYYLSIRSVNGELNDAKTGDLQTVTLPRSAALLDSAVFKVGMP